MDKKGEISISVPFFHPFEVKIISSPFCCSSPPKLRCFFHVENIFTSK